MPSRASHRRWCPRQRGGPVTVLEVAKWGVEVAILAIPFFVGLQVRPVAAVYLLRRWELGLRAMVAMYVIVPALTVVFCLYTDLGRPVEAALVVLSVAPMLTTLHFLMERVGVEHD